MISIQSNFSCNISTSNSGIFSSANILYLIIAGFCMSLGVVVPGVSSTVILMCLGVYYQYLEAISTMNFYVLIPMGVGLVIGCITFLLCIKFLFKHFYAQTFYSIIGFVIGSVFVLLPDVNSISANWYSILLLLVGYVIALKFSTTIDK